MDITEANLSIFENISNQTNQTSANNTSKSFFKKLDENPPLKYGLILFLVIIVIIVAYIIYLNYGDSSGGGIVFDRDFSPTGRV